MSDANKKPNVAWIEGAYFISHDILSKIRQKYADAEFVEIDATTNYYDLCTSLATRSLFHSVKLVLIKDLPELSESDKKKLISLLENLHAKILCVFFMLDSSKHKSLYKTVEKNGKTYVNTAKIPIGEARAYFESRLKLHGMSLEEDAFVVFLENLQLIDNHKFVSADAIEQYIRKLVMYCGQNKKITIDDVISNIGFSDNFIVWNLLRECDNKNYEQCLNLFAASVRSSKNSTTALAEMLGMLCWKYRMLLSLKDNMASGLNQQQAIEKTSQLRKIAYDGVGLLSIVKSANAQASNGTSAHVSVWSTYICNQACNGYYGKKPQIELYSRKDLYLIVECINNCVYLSRTCESEAEATFIADALFATICNHDYATSYRNILSKIEQARKKYA